MKSPSRYVVFPVATLALLASGCGSDSEGSSANSSDASTSTTVAAGDDTTTTTANEDGAEGSFVGADPVEAATNFAVDVLGFVDPEISEPDDAAATSIDLDIAVGGRATTTVTVLELGNGSWAVQGSDTGSIQIEETSLDDGSVTVTGTSTAFEGTVQTKVVDTEGAVIAESFFTGGANGEFAPFTTTIELTDATSTPSYVVLYTISMETGDVWEASSRPLSAS